MLRVVWARLEWSPRGVVHAYPLEVVKSARKSCFVRVLGPSLCGVKLSRSRRLLLDVGPARCITCAGRWSP